MATNLSRAFLEGTGVVPSLVHELASAGNFHESRESFHDFIYSKLIHSDDKGINPSETKPNSSVFPNTDLTINYMSSLAGLDSTYVPGPNIGSSSAKESSNKDNCEPVSSELDSTAVNSPSLNKSASSRKSGNLKKKLSQVQNDTTAQQSSVQSAETPGRVKKKSYHKKKEKTHVCSVCGRAFAEKYTLNRHMLTHTHIKPYSCSKCKMSFSRSDGLAKHMAAGHRRVDSHHCDVCGGTFNSELSFEQHRREYGSTLPFVCNLCMLAFSQCCHLNYHMKSHSLSKLNDGLGYDGQDDKTAIDVSGLIPDDFTPPTKDQQKFSTADLIGTFSKTGNGYMGKGHHSLNMLDPDVVIKPEVDDFPTCSGTINHQFSDDSSVHRSGFGNNSFDTLNSFPGVTSTASHGLTNSHQPSQDDDNLKEGNTVSSPSYLPDTSKSLDVSSSSKAFTISDADMTKYYNIKIPNPKFLENSDQHVTTVGEGSLFKCEVCGKGFTRKYHMQRHVKLHTRGPVPRAHLLDWTRRPYACGVCKMGFTRQHHLTRHILIHTGERPHSCHICGRAFRRYTNLSLHIRTVHGAERPFKCHICGRGFPRLYSLQRHLKLHARNANAFISESTDQLYKGFKAVGTIDVLNLKSHVFSSTNPNKDQQTLGNSLESLTPDHCDNEEEFKDKRSEALENLEHIGSNVGSSMGNNQERCAFLQTESCLSFQPLNDQHIQNTDQTRSCHSAQMEDSHGQAGQPKVRSPLESDNRSQPNRRIGADIDNMKLQDPAHIRASNDFTSLLHHGETTRSEISLKARSAVDFNLQQLVQNTSDVRLISSGAVSNQNMMMLNMPVGGNFHDLDLADAGTYSQIQRHFSSDGFAIPHQQSQGPLPMVSSLLERPGSRSKISHDTYHLPSSSYSQLPSSLQIQQRSNINLQTSRKTGSPASMQDHGGYSHNNCLDSGVTQSSNSEPSGYSHNHSVNGMQFQVGSHGIYNHLLSSSLNQVDLHPHPTASPMPVTSHNNMQY